MKKRLSLKADMLDSLNWATRYTNRPTLKAPEDPEVLALCEKWGFGAVMDSASRQWFKKDKLGAMVVGPCYGTAEGWLEQAKGKK